MEKTHFEKSEAINLHIVQNTESNSKQTVKENEHPEWLPDGWKVDVKIRKTGAHMGAVYKCYVDPSSGSKFYSKPEVLRYLETLKGNSCTFKKENWCTVMDSTSEAVVEKSTMEDLPLGCIKEVKTMKTGNGLQKTLQFAAKRQRSTQSASRQQLFAGSSELLDADNSKKGQDVKVSAETIVASVPTGETVVKMHFLEDLTANMPEIKEKSDPADMQGKNYFVNVMESANAKNHNNRSASKNKKQLIVPHRYSKRLAGIEPNLAANAGVFEQDLQVLKGKLRESRIAFEADMENKNSQWLHDVPEFEHGHKDSMDTSHGDSLNKCNNLSEDREVYREPACRLATEKIYDKKPEHQHSPAQDSISPSLNEAIKTVADELPTQDNPHDSHGLASETTVQKDNKAHMSSIGKSRNKIHANLNKSSNKRGHHVPSRASKRLAGFEPELKTNSMYCEKALEYQNRKSKSKVNIVAPQSEDGPATELRDPASTNMRATINGGSSNERSSPKIPAITGKQEEKVGDEKMNGEKSEQPSFAFRYSWSDPCLEFAIKTLTGVLTVGDTVDNRPTLVPETDALKKGLFESGNTNRQPGLMKSKNKKDLRLPRRLSKRLAGHKPELVATERALEYSARKPNKEKTTATGTLSDGAYQHFDAGEEKDCPPPTSDSSKTRVYAESSNKSEKSEEVQTVPGKQLQELEAGKLGDEVPKPQLPLQFEDCWSDDPCLEFAIRTLTGALPEDAATESLTFVTSDIDAPQSKELLETVVEKSINIKDLDNLTQSKYMTELSLACQTSDQLVGQPELRTISAPCENAPEFANSDEASITRNLEEGEALHIEAGNVTKLAIESRNINTLIVEMPLKKDEQVLRGEAVPAMLRQPETQAMNYEKSDSQFCAPFIDSWSDPCLEFAFRTLTGELPVDESLTIPGCLLEPSQWNNRSMLPDFGSPSFSQSVISSPHGDLGGKSMTGQQSPMSSSFLPLHGYAGVDSQKPYSQGNNFKERMYFP